MDAEYDPLSLQSQIFPNMASLQQTLDPLIQRLEKSQAISLLGPVERIELLDQTAPQKTFFETSFETAADLFAPNFAEQDLGVMNRMEAQAVSQAITEAHSPGRNSNYQRWEAEDALLRGGTYISTDADEYSGDGFVEGYTKPGAATTFNIEVAEAGDYYVTLRYLNGPPAAPAQRLSQPTPALNLFVNDIEPVPFSLVEPSQASDLDLLLENINLLFKQTYTREGILNVLPTDRFDLFLINLRASLKTLFSEHLPAPRGGWQSKTELVSLQAGINKITYQQDENNAGGVALDYLWLSKAADNGPIGVPILTSDRSIEVKKFVQIPDASNGRPRLNSFAYAGDRLFVSEERDGQIYEIIDNGHGRKTTQPFLNLKSATQLNTGRSLSNSTAWHGGLRGIAFHPEFATNGKFYTSIMEDRPTHPEQHIYLSDSSDPIHADSVLIEWAYDHQQSKVDIDSYREVFRIGIPIFDHPIKQIAFNPFAEPGDEDYGLLYVAHGDGSVQSATAGGGMRSDGLGKILRIDPLQQGEQSYTVPMTNPFVGDPTMIDEVFSLGHRNPHTLSFSQDAQGSSHLVVGEVGRDNVEEINLIVPGGNYGWPDREGTFVHLPAGGGIIQGVAPLPADDVKYGYHYPAVQWGHNGQPGQGFVGQAVAGGYVILNGSALDGQYIFADFAESGRIFYADFDDMLAAVTQLDLDDLDRDTPSELSQAQIREAMILFDHDNDASTPALLRASMKDVIDDEVTYDASERADLRFGQGPEGELYILNKRNGYIYLVTSSLVGGASHFLT